MPTKKNNKKTLPQAFKGTEEVFPFPVVDLETTGLDERRHGIVSIGAVWPGSGRAPFYGECRPWEGAEIDPRALAVNGEKEEELRARPVSEGELTVRFLAWLGGPVALAGMNPSSLDSRMLGAAVGRLRGWVCHRSLDLHSLAARYAFRHGVAVPARGFATDEIYAMLGMEPEPKPHNALTGAEMEFKAFAKIFEDDK